MIRDGGSLAVIWSDAEGHEHWLVFPVRIESVDDDHNKIGDWLDPEVQDRSAGVSERISWASARVLINQLRTHVKDAADLARLNAMDDVAAQEGKITASSQAEFHSVGIPRRVFRPDGAKKSKD